MDASERSSTARLSVANIVVMANAVKMVVVFMGELYHTIQLNPLHSIPHNLRTLQQIHFPTTGILRRRSARKTEAANVIAAVVKMASGVERCGINRADTGTRMNI